MINLIKGDCFKEMDILIEQGVKVDSIIADIPYGTTACKWDVILPFNKHIKFKVNRKERVLYEDEAILELCNQGMEFKEAKSYFKENCEEGMWNKIDKLIKPNGAIVLFGSEPFSSALRMSNINNYKYDWVWNKPTATGHLNAKKQPMRAYENISIFYAKQPTYNFQKTQGHKRKVSSAISRGKSIERAKSKSKVYNDEIAEKVTDYDSTERYPRNIITFSTDKQKSKLHPTQKPVALMEYLIKTYTNKGELVLDFTMGSGSTGVAAKNTKRNFIGIEMDDKYFEIAEKRINE